MNGIVPILVFDGARLPMKKRTEEERKKAREESRQKAEQCMSVGDISGANKKFMEAVEINDEMIYRFT